MDLELASEVRVLFLSALSGVTCAFLYDLFKIIRRTFQPGVWLTFMLDMLFWILSALLAFGMLLFSNHGQMRLFEMIAMAVGALVYFLSVSSVIVACGTVLLKRLLSGIFFVFRILFFPFRMLNRHLIRPVCKKTAKKIRKIRKNRLTIRFFWFKINKGMVFFRKYLQK
ncbi:MAG: spore cortex biosynthesis protein YabQ [Clostridia bacterium]|nr:spore cortex biosynthesis protein YabQ [Clostridia bacterium]